MIVCDPTPAVAGLNVVPVTPGPLNVPPIGEPVNVTTPAVTQIAGYVPALTTGSALTTIVVVAEFEQQASAIVANFGVQDQALLDIISGAAEPSGLLPVQMPANMKTVEEQKEDTPHDMDCYVDSEGHKYDFGYGLNWKGIISDARTNKYKVSGAKKSF